MSESHELKGSTVAVDSKGVLFNVLVLKMKLSVCFFFFFFDRKY